MIWTMGCLDESLVMGYEFLARDTNRRRSRVDPEDFIDPGLFVFGGLIGIYELHQTPSQGSSSFSVRSPHMRQMMFCLFISCDGWKFSWRISIQVSCI